MSSARRARERRRRAGCGGSCSRVLSPQLIKGWGKNSNRPPRSRPSEGGWLPSSNGRGTIKGRKRGKGARPGGRRGLGRLMIGQSMLETARRPCSSPRPTSRSDSTSFRGELGQVIRRLHPGRRLFPPRGRFDGVVVDVRPVRRGSIDARGPSLLGRRGGLPQASIEFRPAGLLARGHHQPHSTRAEPFTTNGRTVPVAGRVWRNP